MEIVTFLLLCGIIVSLFVKKDRKQKRDDNLKSYQNISVGKIGLRKITDLTPQEHSI